MTQITEPQVAPKKLPPNPALGDPDGKFTPPPSTRVKVISEQGGYEIGYEWDEPMPAVVSELVKRGVVKIIPNKPKPQPSPAKSEPFKPDSDKMVRPGDVTTK